MEINEETGEASQQQLKEALQRSGMRSPFILERLLSRPEGTTSSQGLNIFEMDRNWNVEHSFSSGARDPVPSAENFEELASFADENGRFYAKQMKEMMKHYIAKDDDPNPERGGDQMTLVMAGMVQVAIEVLLRSHF